MTPQQLTTLKAAIDADATMAAFPNNDDGFFALAVYLNQPVTPAYQVWKQSVTVQEIMNNGFEWARVDNATVGKARIWEWMMLGQSINPSKSNIRDGIQQAWNTAANDGMRLAIYSHCYKPASRAEKIFATGTGAAADKDGVGPGSTTLEFPVDASDVQLARNPQ